MMKSCHELDLPELGTGTLGCEEETSRVGPTNAVEEEEDEWEMILAPPTPRREQTNPFVKKSGKSLEQQLDAWHKEIARLIDADKAEAARLDAVVTTQGELKDVPSIDTNLQKDYCSVPTTPPPPETPQDTKLIPVIADTTDLSTDIGLGPIILYLGSLLPPPFRIFIPPLNYIFGKMNSDDIRKVLFAAHRTLFTSSGKPSDHAAIVRDIFLFIGDTSHQHIVAMQNNVRHMKRDEKAMLLLKSLLDVAFPLESAFYHAVRRIRESLNIASSPEDLKKLQEVWVLESESESDSEIDTNKQSGDATTHPYAQGGQHTACLFKPAAADPKTLATDTLELTGKRTLRK